MDEAQVGLVMELEEDLGRHLAFILVLAFQDDLEIYIDRKGLRKVKHWLETCLIQDDNTVTATERITKHLLVLRGR